MDEIEIQRLPPSDNEVAMSIEDAAVWMVANGSIMTVTRDGVMYRIVDPWEPAASPNPTKG